MTIDKAAARSITRRLGLALAVVLGLAVSLAQLGLLKVWPILSWPVLLRD